MCIVETVTESDGTYTAFCYCGWSTDGIESDTAAESIAQQHQNGFDAANPPVSG